MQDLLLSKLETSFVFKLRPEPIPGDLRPLWRIGVVLLILRLASRGARSSLGRLHVLNWAVRSKQNQKELIRLISGDISPDAIIVRIEPSLNRAIDLAQGEGLLTRISGSRLKLTKVGLERADLLIKSKEIFIKEKEFLQNIGKQLTETVTNKLFSWKG